MKRMENTVKRLTVGAALGGALLLSAGMGVANAEPGDGRVDVALGTAGVLDNVPLGAASQIAASVCDRDFGQVTPVAENVDVTGAVQNVCNNTLGAIELRQNTADTAPDTGAAEQQPDATEETAVPEDTETAPTTTVAPDSPEETNAPAG
jgi:hypothetical protein